MKIIPEKKAILLRVRDPERIRAVVPHAKSVQHQGKEHLAVPHQIEVVQVLRNLGIDAPSPIGYYYEWSGRYKPFEHQRHVAAFLTLHNRAFNLVGMGGGKTISTLWAYDYLRSREVVGKALIITPLSTMERTWGDEMFNHFPHLDYVVLHGTREKRLALLNQDVDCFIINHDGIKVNGFVEALKNRPDIDLIIVDEIAQVGRTAGTGRFKALNAILNKQHPRRAWGLTGTPIPNLPTDAWAQCRLLVPEKVAPYFNRFKDQVMRQVSQFVWLPRDNALDVVQEVMQPAIRYSLEECVDLPECIYETREVPLTKEQASAYKDMLAKLRLQVDQGEVTAVNEAVKAQKLVQIAAGCVYGSHGEELDLDAGPRLEVLLEVIEQASTKVIVFAPFVAVSRKIQAFLESKGVTTGLVISDTSRQERDQIFSAFKRSVNPRVIVASPGTMSHGLNLQEANTIVWFAPITSADTWGQANARVRRPGQKHAQLIVMLEGTPIERKYFQRLKDKEATQGVLLDMIRLDRETA